MAFGTSMADATRKKLGRCLDKCSSSDTDCRDRTRELNNIQLDEPAATRGRSAVDSSASPSAKKADAPLATRAQREADERLEETPREAPKDKPAAAKLEQPAPARRELREDEVPRSSRTEVKAVDKKPEAEPAPARPEAEKPAPARAEAQPQKPAAPEKKKAESKPRPLDEWDPSAL